MDRPFKNQVKNVLTKIVASSLVVTLGCGNFLVCGNYFVTYAAENRPELDKQTDVTLSKNVKFDAYFVEDDAKTHYKTADINTDLPELVLTTTVEKEGYLKNATIDLKSEDNKNDLNYTIIDIEDSNAIVQSASENQLVLRQINSGNKVEFVAKLAAGVKEIDNLEKLDSISKISLKGLYIDGQGEETPIDKEIKINLAWKAHYEAMINQALTKYIPIQNVDVSQNKVLISMQMETGLAAQKFMLPIKETNLEISVPVINNKKPKSVTVNAISLEATTGEASDGLKFTEENWNYDEAESKIKINVKNEDLKLGKNVDSYMVNYVYSNDAFDYLTNNKSIIQSRAKVSLTTFTGEVAEAEITNDMSLEETIGKLISLKGENITEKISKGKLYANMYNPQSEDGLEYEYKWNINVGFTEGLKCIELKEPTEMLITPNNMIGNLKGKALYRQIRFNSASFDELLGEEGLVSVYNDRGDLLALVGKDSRTDSKGNYVVDFFEGVENLEIVTTKPVKAGNLSISIKKEIKSDLGFSKSQIDSFERVLIVAQALQVDETTGMLTAVEEQKVEIELEKTITKSKISINKEKLSTLVKNENVEMTIELGNDNETSDFYVDPVFEIELPKVVENVEIVDSRILFDDVLLLDNVEFTKENGTPMIRVKLKGVQKKYNNGIATNGTNIILRTNIYVNNLAPSSMDEIKMYYYNSNIKNYYNSVQTARGLGGLATANVEFIAPVGMITVNAMENYDGKGSSALTLHQGDVINLVETYKPARIMKMNLITINNTGNTCTDVVAIGRIPFAGNKDLVTGEELGTTLDTYLRSYVTSNNLQGDGIKVYYSENGFATTAITDEANAWTLTPTDLSKVKSFMIVLEGYEMKQGEMFTFSYEIEYPMNVGYNNSIVTNYGVYYINNTQVASVSSFAKSDNIGITTGRGPELEVNQRIEGVGENKTTEAYKVLKYVIEISNKGTEAAKNVRIENKIPKWSYLVRSKTGGLEYSNMEVYQVGVSNMAEWNVISNPDSRDSTDTPTVGWTIENVNPGETITREVLIGTTVKPSIYEYYSKYPGFTVGNDGKYYVATQKYNAETDTSYEEYNEITEVPDISVQNIVMVSADNINVVLKSSSETVDVDDNKIVMTEESNATTKDFVVEGEEITFTVAVINQFEEEVKNIKISKIIPEGLKFIEGAKVKTDDWQEKGYGNLGENVTQEELNAALQEGTITISDLFPEEESIGVYLSDAREYVVNVDSLKSGEMLTINIRATVEKLTNVYEKEITTNTKYQLGEGETAETGESTPLKFYIERPHCEVSFECSNKNSRINAGDELIYIYRVKNIGKVEIPSMMLTQEIPSGLEFIKGEYTMMGMNVEEENIADNNFMALLTLQPGEELYVYIYTRVKEIPEDKLIFVNGVLSGTNVDTFHTEAISHTIEKTEGATYPEEQSGENSNGGGNDNSGNANYQQDRYYKIGGVVWLDTNENGQKDEGEKVIQNVAVRVFTESMQEVGNSITDDTGRYLLTNLPNGKYFVMFRYDEKIYGVTTYQEKGVSEVYNSNAIEKEMLENSSTYRAGVTDTINLDKTLSDINLGLVEKSKFDLKLEKSITKITLQNGQGVKEYSFDNSKLAKVEVPASQIAKTMVVIEYTISVTNEGNVPGFAKNIVDYKESELSFNSSLNSDWYAGTDGNVYTTALQDTIINPGETKEIKLVLTKNMNSDNLGFTNNVAEIYEAYNEYGLDDRNSTPANNAQGENDRGSADAAVIVKTGEGVIYIALIILVLAIFVSGVALIKKITGRRKEEVRW